MRAVACADRTLSVVDLPDPSAAKGQLVLGVLRCGICGSDLHARQHCDDLAEVMEELDDYWATHKKRSVGPAKADKVKTRKMRIEGNRVKMM